MAELFLCRPTREKDSHCILDCVYHPYNDTYYVLDLMSWKGYNLYDSSSEFRMFWIHSKLCETTVSAVSKFNKYKFAPLPLLDANLQVHIQSWMDIWFIWMNNPPNFTLKWIIELNDRACFALTEVHDCLNFAYTHKIGLFACIPKWTQASAALSQSSNASSSTTIPTTTSGPDARKTWLRPGWTTFLT